jgi:hypothetical protein
MLSLTSLARAEAVKEDGTWGTAESRADTTPDKVIGMRGYWKKLHFSQRQFDCSNIGGCFNGGQKKEAEASFHGFQCGVRGAGLT